MNDKLGSGSFNDGMLVFKEKLIPWPLVPLFHQNSLFEVDDASA